MILWLRISLQWTSLVDETIVDSSFSQLPALARHLSGGSDNWLAEGHVFSVIDPEYLSEAQAPNLDPRAETTTSWGQILLDPQDEIAYTFAQKKELLIIASHLFRKNFKVGEGQMNKEAITKHDIYHKLSGFSEQDLYAIVNFIDFMRQQKKLEEKKVIKLEGILKGYDIDISDLKKFKEETWKHVD